MFEKETFFDNSSRSKTSESQNIGKNFEKSCSTTSKESAIILNNLMAFETLPLFSQFSVTFPKI